MGVYTHIFVNGFHSICFNSGCHDSSVCVYVDDASSCQDISARFCHTEYFSMHLVKLVATSHDLGPQKVANRKGNPVI